jgi:HEAT repeat protein
MQDDEIQASLSSADEAARLRAVRYLAGHEARPAFFKPLTDLIADAHEHIRFFALTALVRQYPHQLRADAVRLVPRLMDRLLDENGTVTDRALWALNITGETALPQLLAATEDPNVRMREMATGALARNHQIHVATEVALPALLRRLDDEDDGVRFAALGEVMNLTPLRTSPAGTLTEVDFEPIYDQLLPVAEQFSRHPDAHYQKWAAYLLELLNNR